MKILKLLKTQGYSRKLKTQLIASFISISAVIMMMGSLFIYFSVLDIIKKQNEIATLNLFKKAEYNIKNIKNEVEKVSRLVIVDDDYKKVAGNEFDSELDKVNTTKVLLDKMSTIITNYDYIDSIFSFGENGFILGVSQSRVDFSLDQEKKSWFYKSSIYKTVKTVIPRVIWSGLYSNRDFNVSDSSNALVSGKLITCARNIRIEARKDISTTFVVNIKEKYFNSFFNSNEDMNRSMYLLNKNGSIISHADGSKIGEKCSFYNEFSKKTKSGSFTTKEDNNSVQVVYYRLNPEGWMLVSEIPFKVFFSDIFKIRITVIFVFMCSLVAMFLLSLYWIYRLTRPLNDLTIAMKKIGDGTLGVILKDLPKNELGKLGDQFNKMSSNILQLANKNRLFEKEKRELEIEALQMQINPHFLYNTLNIIKWMAVVANNYNIEDSIITLGNIIKPIFKNPSLMWTFKEEFELIKSYMKIINIRFGENINTSFEIEGKIGDLYTLKFMLQPIIENSFIHGIYDFNTKLNITVSALSEGEDILIIVEDDGKGMSEEKLIEVNEVLSQSLLINHRDTKVGISNVNRRIKLYFGDEYGLSIRTSIENGIRVTIKLPKIPKPQ